VSFRRVVNVPARGVGKSVLEALEAVDPGDADAETPLFAAGLSPVASTRSMWARLVVAIDRKLLPPRAAAALAAFRDIITGLIADVQGASVSIALGLVLDRSGYLRALREERSEDAEARIENLMELVSAGREYESREADATLAGFVDRLSLLSEADEAAGAANAQVWLMSMHAAKGLEFPTVIVAGMEEGLFPHSRSVESEEDIEEERRICYVCITRAKERLILTGANRRRVFGDYQPSEPSRFLDEIPPELMQRIEPAPASARWQQPYGLRNPYARRGPRVRETEPAYSYESEDQSRSGVRTGMRVRHRQFGVGTVLDIEEQGDDFKLTVKFAAVGTKKLLARYAGLEPA
jgi:DNA helicase-2/ATP-dependent DNA helicase PcrA